VAKPWPWATAGGPRAGELDEVLQDASRFGVLWLWVLDCRAQLAVLDVQQQVAETQQWDAQQLVSSLWVAKPLVPLLQGAKLKVGMLLASVLSKVLAAQQKV
jgi:hypothetical protein